MTDTWTRYQQLSLRCPDLGFSLDLSRMPLSLEDLQAKKTDADRAFAEMQALEGGEIANPDEGRMVGHYWLRDANLAPTPELKAEIEGDLAEVTAFGEAVRQSEIKAANGQTFRHLLVVGIGGSALGPQLVADALLPPDSPISIHFFDNTDPGGMARTVAEIGTGLSETLTVVISKSGGTKETRNGMLEAAAAYQAAGLDFASHAVAVTGPGSLLDQHAEGEGWLKRFPMADWVGGRTSVMSVVGLVPFAIVGIDIPAFLEGARLMDAHTRLEALEKNPAMLQALAWHVVGNGKGEKDLVVLPYCDHLVLFSKYLQQLIMESLGKELDRDGKVVNQGIAVYGNKGSTDQHAYVQQLRDGVANFFATFIEVRNTNAGTPPLEVEPGVTSSDYLQGFLRGTREALSGNGRPSITLSVPEVSALHLGALIALFERSVGFYASLVNINAYHQPGVEAGKKAAGEFLELVTQVRESLESQSGQALSADAVAASIGSDPEPVYHALVHLASTRPNIGLEAGASPAEDRFTSEG